MKKIVLFLIVFFQLIGCEGITSSQPFSELDSTPISSLDPELMPPSTTTVLPTLTPESTATSDTRLPPERWQEWPVIPAITGRGIEIYRKGSLLGNNPHAFSKVGDCQSVKAAFMGFLDIPDRIPDTLEYRNLQATIDNFSGFFDTDGQAVKGGFNAATVLSPLWANPDVCLAGENPLECELRLTKPIIVFISFEVWWEGRTPEQYERYMRQIIDITIDHGAVPILATKADNVEGDHSINLTTAKLAHEYDLPLFNFWLAVQSLPYYGLDPERDDGFHISTEAWNVHSFTGLQTLDSIWRGLREFSSGDSSLATTTPITGGTPEIIPSFESEPKLMDSNNSLIFGMAQREGSLYNPIGVTLYDFTLEQSRQILGTGWDFQDASSNGHSLLVNLNSSLYLTDGLTLTLVSSDFYNLGNVGAMFLDDDTIVFIKTKEMGTVIEKIPHSGGGSVELAGPIDPPIELYTSTDGVNITWESGICSSFRVCERRGAWMTNLLSGQFRSISSLSRPLIAPDGAALAYLYQNGENKTNLGFATSEGVPTRTFPLYGDILDAYAWEPGGGWLAVHLALRSDYSGLVTDGTNFLVDPTTFETKQFASILLLNPIIVWSMGGDKLVWLGTDWITEKYSIRLFEVEIDTGMTTNLSNKLSLSSSGYIFVTNGSWVDTKK